MFLLSFIIFHPLFLILFFEYHLIIIAQKLIVASFQVRDAVAVMQLLMWLEKAVPAGKQTELSASVYADYCRRSVSILSVRITMESESLNILRRKKILSANRRTTRARALRPYLQVDPMLHWHITGKCPQDALRYKFHSFYDHTHVSKHLFPLNNE